MLLYSSLLGAERSALSNGCAGFVESLEERCLLSAIAPARVAHPAPTSAPPVLNYIVGAGTTTNAISAATNGQTVIPSLTPATQSTTPTPSLASTLESAPPVNNILNVNVAPNGANNADLTTPNAPAEGTTLTLLNQSNTPANAENVANPVSIFAPVSQFTASDQTGFGSSNILSFQSVVSVFTP